MVFYGYHSDKSIEDPVEARPLLETPWPLIEIRTAETIILVLLPLRHTTKFEVRLPACVSAFMA
jgi:hypothetical protein